MPTRTPQQRAPNSPHARIVYLERLRSKYRRGSLDTHLDEPVPDQLLQELLPPELMELVRRAS